MFALLLTHDILKLSMMSHSQTRQRTLSAFTISYFSPYRILRSRCRGCSDVASQERRTVWKGTRVERMSRGVVGKGIEVLGTVVLNRWKPFVKLGDVRKKLWEAIMAYRGVGVSGYRACRGY